MMNRRTLLIALGATALALTVAGEADARPIRRARRRTRRRIRRRHRRRVTRRVIAGRPHLVVPVALTAGWEVETDEGVFLVDEVRREADGVEVATLAGGGRTITIAIVREDDDTNRVERGGSELPDGDVTTPGYDAEIEVDE